MQSHVSRHAYGETTIITHYFTAAGDELPVHNHKDRPHLNHVTRIVSGQFEVLGERAGATAGPDDLIEWRADEDHGLRALTAGAIAINVRPRLATEIHDLPLNRPQP